MDEATNQMNTGNWGDDRASDDRDENTEQLRAGIEDTRAEMSQTINEIQERLSPENVMDQVKEKVREATVGKVERVMERVGETISEVTEPAREVIGRAGSTIKDTGRSAAGVVRKYPIPVALIGLGVGMLVARAVRGNGYDYDDMSRGSRTRRQNVMGNQGQGGYGMGSQDQSEYAMGQTHNLAQRSTEALNNLSNKAKDSASAIGNRVGQVMRQNPLAVGAVAIAAGTAVGLALPATRFEHDYIGETSERVVDKAQEVARQAIDKVQSAAQQQMAPESQPGT
jgi:ElaB/YqjD/DUF883 family membrane-anchored ribosome-binding protein